MISRIPMTVFQTAVYRMLREKQTARIYDDVGTEDNVMASCPFVSFGAYRCEPSGAKNAVVFNVTLNLEIWSEYEGKKEINEIADDLAAAYTAWPLDLSEDGFCVIDQDIESLEAFPEERRGYHGTLSVTAKIQFMGGTE